MPTNSRFINLPVRSAWKSSRTLGGELRPVISLTPIFWDAYTVCSILINYFSRSKVHQKVHHQLFRPTKRSSLENLKASKSLARADWTKIRVPQIKENLWFYLDPDSSNQFKAQFFDDDLPWTISENLRSLTDFFLVYLSLISYQYCK